MSMISEQVKRLREYADGRKGEISQICREAADTIDVLPEKVRTQNLGKTGWIPVTERLPEVFPYKADGAEFEESNDVLICSKNGNMYVATYEIDSPDRQYWVDECGFEFKDIIAWMPLPEPYKDGDTT